MKILYYDCFMGISGDMNLGALLDLGVDEALLREQLSLLGLDREFQLVVHKGNKKGIGGTQVVVHLISQDQGHHYHEKHLHEHPHGHSHQHHHQETHHHEEHHHHHHEEQDHHGRTLPEIERIIMGSSLTTRIKERSLKMFHLLAEAEGKVHDKPKEEVHFHEVGAVDAIVDIVGAAICLEALQVEAIYASAVQLGGGMVHCDHGHLPVPVPAVLELLQGVPVRLGGANFETTTPTGAAILVANVSTYSDQLQGKIQGVGYGLGTKEAEIPNVLRVWIGETETLETEAPGPWREGVMTILETNIDDMNPELYGYVEEKLFAAGAADVFRTPIVMKKGRLGLQLSVLCAPEREQGLKEILFAETTALGLRSFQVGKTMLHRSIETIQTRYGEVRIKWSTAPGRDKRYKAEYEDCKRIAEAEKIPLLAVYKEIAKEMEKD